MKKKNIILASTSILIGIAGGIGFTIYEEKNDYDEKHKYFYEGRKEIKFEKPEYSFVQKDVDYIDKAIDNTIDNIKAYK